MSPQAQIVMLLWLPVVLFIFSRVNSQKAVAISFIFAWLFLPQKAGFIFSGLPDYTRMSATCYGILLGTLIFDAKRLRTFRAGWIDAPMIVWCLCPILSSLANDLGLYDGVSSSIRQTVAYGLPYFLGRIYFNDLAALRLLSISMFIGGLVYLPLCLFEIRMSPQIHRLVYGYHGINEFSQGIRLGGFRPAVFMQHGLSVAMWMMAALLIGIWLYQAGVLKKILGIPMIPILIVFTITFVLLRSSSAYIYFFYGLVILFFAKTFRTALPLLILIASIWFYIFLGATGGFKIENIQSVLDIIHNIEPARAQSLEFRLINEEILGERARERIIFGWGGWGRNRVYEEDWQGDLVDVSTTDSLWIISFGINGIVGLFAIFSATLLPAFSFFWLKYPARLWFTPKVAPAAVLTVVITLYMVDCCLNNQPNPVFILISGGIAGLVLNKSETIISKSVPISRKITYLP